ncbi:MAG: ABC transporter ATP-binding protein [Desulfobacula sp.]|uniref:ABC transporter ATP-binding protein n=1 Tax=Desulfobacula sp. TaxID=2593537 RepID=UPI0025BB7B60|nr:ABC transporter ATP-binding protein [Desulfobacula sp.]MCD4719702.1 ABC transporter ATP-binding protein [Desulfobacula sp.]
MAEIVIKDLNKKFGEFTAVNNSNLTIKDGEFFVLLGPSGCGKTTTLRMIAGLELPTTGKIFLDNKDVTFLRTSQRDIAFVFQLFALYPHMNVEKNIGFPLKIQGVSKRQIKDKVIEVSKMLHLEHLLKLKVSGLSGGDRQRVALGRSIIRRPKAFLMDEPLGALDAEFREMMCFELRKLHNDINATTVYVTHDQIEAMSMGDRVGIMNKGIVLQADDPLTIYNKPKTMFVGKFIGSPAMNFIKINSVIQKGKKSIKINDRKIEIPKTHEDSKATCHYLGIRPENIVITNDGEVRGKVFGVEYLGAHQIVTADTEVGRLKVRTSSHIQLMINDTIGLHFLPDNIIIFNGETEVALKSQFIL